MTVLVEDHEIEWFREDLLEWYRHNGREFAWRSPETTLYQHVLAEILLQRTRAETLAPFFEEFTRKYRGWSAIANLSVQQLEQELQPIGLARQRAPRISAFSKIMVREKGSLPDNLNELLLLPAIGQYVAYAIQSFRGLWRLPLLDTGMARVIERHFGIKRMADIRYDAGLQEICQRIVDTDPPLEISWAILDVAAFACRPKKPRCDQCPVARFCEFNRKS